MLINSEVEENLAASARAWMESLSASDEERHQNAERSLADALEIWIAALLSTEPSWQLTGRWFDGLLFESCVAKSADQIKMKGFIVRIATQRVDPFYATVQFKLQSLQAFDVRFGNQECDDGIPYDQSSNLVGTEPAWRHHFIGKS